MAVIVSRIALRLPTKSPTRLIVVDGPGQFTHALLFTISLTSGDLNFTLRNRPADCCASFAALRAMRRASSRSTPYASKIAVTSISTNFFSRDCAALCACASVIEWAICFAQRATAMKMRRAVRIAAGADWITERKPAAHKPLAFNYSFHGGQEVVGGIGL